MDELSERAQNFIDASQDGSIIWTMKKSQGDGFTNINKSELSSLAQFFNKALNNDPLVNGKSPILPVDDSSAENFCAAFSDGRLLASLINLARPNTLNTEGHLSHLERMDSITKKAARKRKHSLIVMEWLNEAIKACEKIPGVVVVNVGALDFVSGKPNIILGLVWQLVSASFMNKIGLRFHPEIVRLIDKEESLEEFYNLPEEKLLFRWVNWHLQEDALQQGGTPLKITNFGRDVKDCRIYNALLRRLDNSLSIADEKDPRERAQHVLDNITELGVPDVLTTAIDIEKGHTKMNAALFAQIFNLRSGLERLSESDLTLVSRIAQSEGLHNIAVDLQIYQNRESEIPTPKRGELSREKAANWKALKNITGLTDGITHLEGRYGHIAASSKTIFVKPNDDEEDGGYILSATKSFSNCKASSKTVIMDDTDVCYKESASSGLLCFMCSENDWWISK